MMIEISITKKEDKMMHQDRLKAYRSAIRDSKATVKKEA